MDASRSLGTSVTTLAIRFAFATSRRRSGSKATLPQLKPPATPGNWTEPARLGGVKIPSERLAAIFSRHLPRSQGVSPQASSGERPGGCSGGGQRRKRLGRRERLAGPAGLRNRPLLDREERHARLAVEQEDVPHLGRLGDRRQRAALAAHLDQRRLRRDVEVPEIVVDGLEAPDHLARRAAQRDQRAREVIEPIAQAAVEIRARVAHRHEQEIARGVRREDRPGVRRSGAPARRAVRGGRQRRRPGRNRVEGPAQRPAARVEAAHHAAGSIRAPPVSHQRADGHHVPDQCRRRGDAVFPGQHASQAPGQVEAAALAEVAAEGAVLGIQRQQAPVDGAGEDPAPARLARAAPGVAPERDAPTGELPEVRELDLRIEDPALAAGLGVQREDAVEGRAEVERVPVEDRRRLEDALAAGARSRRRCRRCGSSRRARGGPRSRGRSA